MNERPPRYPSIPVRLALLVGCYVAACALVPLLRGKPSPPGEWLAGMYVFPLGLQVALGLFEWGGHALYGAIAALSLAVRRAQAFFPLLAVFVALLALNVNSCLKPIT